MDDVELAPCGRCETGTVHWTVWTGATDEQREQWRAEGVARRDGRGLCQRCYRWARTNNRLLDYERVNRPTTDVLEDWLHLADPLRPVKDEVRRLAHQFGMKPKTLEQALHRGGVRSRFAGGHGERLKGDAA